MQRTDLTRFLMTALGDKMPKILEALGVGTALGASSWFVQHQVFATENLAQQTQRHDPIMQAFRSLGYLDTGLPDVCDDLIKLVKRYMPEGHSKCIELVYTIDCINVYCQQAETNGRAHPEAGAMSFELSCRATELIGDLSVMLPSGGSLERRGNEMLQRLYQVQDDLGASTRHAVKAALDAPMPE